MTSLIPQPFVQVVPLDLLEPWEANPRRIDEEKMGGLKRSLAEDPEMLRMRPLIALPDGRVFGGNQRLRAMVEMLEESDEEPRWDDLIAFLSGTGGVPTYVVDRDEASARRLAIRDNQGFGVWEQIGLAEFLALEEDHGALGFSDAESDKLAGLIAEDDEPLADDDRENDPEQVPMHRVTVTFTDRYERDQLAEEMTDRGYAVSTASGDWLDHNGGDGHAPA